MMQSAKGPYVATCPVVLASGSPRRRDFLTELGLNFVTVLPADAAEPKPLHGESPVDYVRRAAEAKAQSVRMRLQGAKGTGVEDEGAGGTGAGGTGASGVASGVLVIAADTVVALGDAIMGKPASDAEALSMLTCLAGEEHEVISAVCLLFPDGESLTFHARTKVAMWDVPHEALAAYVATGEARDKAGSYAIQGIGAFLVRSIEGSWTNVVGLPVAELVGILCERGLIVSFVGR